MTAPSPNESSHLLSVLIFSPAGRRRGRGVDPQRAPAALVDARLYLGPRPLFPAALGAV